MTDPNHSDADRDQHCAAGFTIPVEATAHDDAIEAAFEEVEDALMDLEDAIVALQETRASTVHIDGNTHRAVFVDDVLEIDVSVEFNTKRRSHEAAAEAVGDADADGDGGGFGVTD